MSLTDITDTIQQEAEATRKSILEAAEKRVSVLKASSKKQQEEVVSVYGAETEQIKQQNVASVTGMSEREQKKIVDGAKRALVDEVFDRALEALASLNGAEYKKVLVDYLKQLPGDLGECDVYASPEHVAVTKKALTDAKVSGSVHEDKDIKRGGFRVVGSSYEYDFTFEKMMREQKQALEIEVAQTLFGSGE